MNTEDEDFICLTEKEKAFYVDIKSIMKEYGIKWLRRKGETIIYDPKSNSLESFLGLPIDSSNDIKNEI